ncbi:uncharacterized protein EV420DRAFT_1486599 [Desarmillaria tabescens]|uniref:Uncharacterized protein n=1 Tax=Armillaria tabescens TaxID=1929756 RepID=A0AA39JAH3_ARMTA|nr:uncharacterized protein EV420DRAFT_1486599 [Desarmillaria tabescens]KAK0438719.1 hypothetical protein EV420DRAFT_1486599 [Desarmillaria tabescens]
MHHHEAGQSLMWSGYFPLRFLPPSSLARQAILSLVLNGGTCQSLADVADIQKPIKHNQLYPRGPSGRVNSNMRSSNRPCTWQTLGISAGFNDHMVILKGDPCIMLSGAFSLNGAYQDVRKLGPWGLKILWDVLKCYHCSLTVDDLYHVDFVMMHHFKVKTIGSTSTWDNTLRLAGDETRQILCRDDVLTSRERGSSCQLFNPYRVNPLCLPSFRPQKSRDQTLRSQTCGIVLGAFPVKINSKYERLSLAEPNQCDNSLSTLEFGHGNLEKPNLR